MSVDLIKAPVPDAHAEQQERKPPVLLRIVQFGGSLALGTVAAATIGSSIGHNMQDSNLRHDQHALAAMRTGTASDTLLLNKATKKPQALLAALSPACADVVKVFLPGGKDAKLKEYNAETEVQNTRLCPAGDVTLVADARAAYQGITDARAQLSEDNEGLSADLDQVKGDHNESITSVAGQVESIAFLFSTIAGLVVSEIAVQAAYDRSQSTS